MTEALQFFVDRLGNLIDLLDFIKFDMYGYKVSYWGVIFAFIVIVMFASVWWRGAKG